MTESIFTISTGVDDGRCRTPEGTLYDNNNTSLELGWTGSVTLRTYLRFDNIAIPSSAVIDSCVLRFIADTSRALTVANLILHFEDADDPTYPTNGSDVLSRSLTTGVAWSGISGWTAGSEYDSADFATELQTVIDRGGWASGQAVIAFVLDNGSDIAAFRSAATYEHGSYDPPKLVVNWHVPYAPDISESITIEENILIESDLIVQDHINLSENTSVVLGFGEFLPGITQDITIAESVSAFLDSLTLPTQFDSIDLTESVNLLLGFDESLPTITQDITVSEYSVVDISPSISVFESITVSDTGNIRPEPFTFDDINVSEYVLARRGYWQDVEDSFTVSDRFDVFHYTNWIRQNAARASERFFFTLTGATDSTTDIEIPASAIFARKRSGDPTYLQVTVPSFNYATEIALRHSGEMLVDMGYEIGGVINLRERILEADLEDISTYEGPVNRSVVLTGHRTQDFGGQVVTFNRAAVIYRGYQTRARAFRFAFIDPFLNPGDTVVVGSESFTCNNIIYTINALRTTMEVREAL